MSDAQRNAMTSFDGKPPVGGMQWSNHGIYMWNERSRVPEEPPDAAWRRAVPVHYPSARHGAEAYYHPEGDAVLLVRPDEYDDTPTVTTVIRLTDRPEGQQEYVRGQAADVLEGER